MQFVGINILNLITYAGPLAIIIVAVVILYLWYYKPKIAPPLPNERALGVWTLWLPKGFGLHSGYATTARRTLEKWFTQLIENVMDTVQREKLEETRQLFAKFYPIAHKVGRQVFIYLFTHNPEDQNYIDIDPNQNDSYIVHGVQDVMLGGESSKFQFLGVKLNPTAQSFTKDERKLMKLGLGTVKVLEDAAKNTEKIRNLKEERDYYEEQYHGQTQKTAGQRSRADRAESALGQKSLTVSEDVKVAGAWRAKAKEWLNWPQVLTAIIAYMLAPYIQGWLNLTLTPPTTTYFAAFVTVVGFFVIPIGKKMFGRWL